MRNITSCKKKINIYLLLIILIIFGVFQYGIGKICGFTMVPDEFGYWASAAEKIGYDWSEVASLGSYYSFGYSFILLPILYLFGDGVMAYRVAVTVNMLLMCGGILLILGIIKRLFPEIERKMQVFIGGIAVFYPVWIFNMQMTMTEALLMFLFVLIIYLFVCFMQKPNIVAAFFLAASLAYIYCVHMRTGGVLIACGITLALWTVSEHPKTKIVLVFIGTILLFAILAGVLKQNTIAQVFSSADSQVLAGNDYGGQKGKLEQIISPYGMRLFVKEVIGKILYLGLASFGIFYWGIGWTIKKSGLLLFHLFKKRKIEVIEWVFLFLSLAMAGEILICSIYMHPVGTIDALIYGRYDEFLMPVFLMIGIIAMLKSGWLFRGTLLLGTGTGLMLPMLLSVIEARELSGLRGYMVAGISYLLKEDNLDIYSFFQDTWILGFFVMLLVAFFVWLSEKKENLVWMLTGIIVLEITAGLQISSHYTYRVNSSNFMDLTISEEIIDKEEDGDKIVYLDEGAHQYIDFLQMQLGKRAIEVISEGDIDEIKMKISDVFVITHIDTKYKNQLDNMFDECIRANTFYLFYSTEGRDVG